MDPSNGLVVPRGILTCSSREMRVTERGYHNGEIWPHDNHGIADGARRFGHDALANWIDSTQVENAQQLHCYPENLTGGADASPHVNEVLVDIAAHDPVLGDWPNGYTVPQPIQGWAVSSYLDAQRQLTLAHGPIRLTSLARSLLPSLEALQGRRGVASRRTGNQAPKIG